MEAAVVGNHFPQTTNVTRRHKNISESKANVVVTLRSVAQKIQNCTLFAKRLEARETFPMFRLYLDLCLDWKLESTWSFKRIPLFRANRFGFDKLCCEEKDPKPCQNAYELPSFPSRRRSCDLITKLLEETRSCSID